MTTMVDTLIGIAADAARVIREVYDTRFAVDWKAPRDPVTAADRRANDLICQRLSEAYPDVPVVAEESDPRTFEGYQSAERIFFVDPLDGTSEFIERNGEFVVMIGVVEGAFATIGVVVAPARHTAWAGEVGSGAWRISEAGAREPIRVSAVSRLSGSRIVSSRSHRSPALERVLAQFGGAEVVALGSAGLKGAEIARGRAEAYVGPGMVGKRWDACAVDALVSAAGGRFTDGFGELFDYRSENLTNDRGLVATNGLVHDAILAHLADLGP
jgi:3'(2'), 5'-bisphosphate nucleotidase